MFISLEQGFWGYINNEMTRESVDSVLAEWVIIIGGFVSTTFVISLSCFLYELRV